MGLEDFHSSGSGTSLIHNENTGWGTIFVLLLKSVGLDHGSHEDIISVLVESWGDSSLVSLIEHTILLWGENFAGVVISITIAVSELDGGGGSEESNNKSKFHYYI